MGAGNGSTDAFRRDYLPYGEALTEAVAGVVDDFNTLTDGSASAGTQLFAAVSLLLESLPDSIGDVKDVARAVGKGVDALKGADKVGDAERLLIR